MNKDLYLSIIPIGKSNWCDFLERLILSTTINDNGYKCYRLFDQLKSFKEVDIDNMPMFVPYEAINVNDGIKFRITVSYPINEEKGLKVLTPWLENEISYEEAQWISAEKMIGEHSDYAIILKEKHKRNTEDINKIIDICIKYNKPFKVCDCNENFQDIYDYFTK